MYTQTAWNCLQILDTNFHDQRHNYQFESCSGKNATEIFHVKICKAQGSEALPWFFREGTPRPLKGYHAPPAGGAGDASSLMVTKLKNLKRSIRRFISILKIQHFSCTKKFIFFPWKISKMWTYFRKISEFLKKLFSNFHISFFMVTLKIHSNFRWMLLFTIHFCRFI